MIPILGAFIISRYDPATFLDLELQRVLIPIEIHIEHRIPLSLDGDILIKLFIVESSITNGLPMIVPLHLKIIVLISYSVDCAANVSSFGNRLYKVITITRQVLLPDNNRIRGCRLRDPAGVYRYLVRQGLIEVILGATGCLISDALVCKPAAECIAVTCHVRIVRLGRFLSGLDELRRIVGGAFTILIEDKPMSLRCIDAKCDIAGDGDDVVILVLLPFGVSSDIAAAFHNVPTFEMVCVVLDGVAHVDLVALLRSCGIRTESDFFLTKGDLVFIQISNAVVFEQHRIVGHLFAVMCRRQHAANRCTHIGYAERSGVFVVVLISRPPTEIYAIRKSSNTWIIENLLHVIAFFDIHGFDICAVRFDEVNKHTCICPSLNYRIDREAVCIESYLISDYTYAILDLISFLTVIDMHYCRLIYITEIG